MESDFLSTGGASGRHLLFRRISRRANCTVPAIDEFPAGFFTKEQRLHGAVVIHVIVALYILVILAIICHEYFVPAIEKFISHYGMESDVTGASIMAAAGSAPQLATSIIGIFVAKSDIGVGSVVGASYFNIFFIIGLCPFVIKEPIKLAWWPLLRDSFFYCLAAFSVAFLVFDKKIYIYDAIIMVLLYALYLIVLGFNAKLEHVFSTCIRCIRLGFARCACKQCRRSNLRSCVYCDPEDQTESIKLQGHDSLSITTEDTKNEDGAISNFTGYNSFEKPSSPTEKEGQPSLRPQLNSPETSADTEGLVTRSDTEAAEEEKPKTDLEYRSVLQVPKSKWKKVIWVILLPALFIVFTLVPDCRRPHSRRYIFILTIIMSVIVIGLCSYVLVWMVAIVGSTIGIPDTVMGITFLAAGSSLPDVFNAIIVTRHGLGDMAISNCFGSNIFDILISLGLPWLLHIVASPTHLEPVSIFEDVSTVSISLLASAFILITCLYINKFSLNKCLGGMLIGAYICFVTFTIIFDAKTSLPDCDSVS